MNRVDIKQIRELRLALGMSQYALARESQVARHKISLFECGYGSLDEKEERAISKALNARRKQFSQIRLKMTAGGEA